MTRQQRNEADCEGVPVIDMSLDDEKVAQQFLQAFTTIGFATLTNHGVKSSIISRAFDASKSFFDLEVEEKLLYKFQGYKSNRGYIPIGLEKHDGSLDMKPDKKETFDIGNENEDGFENEWPTSTKGKSKDEFRRDVLSYFDAFDELHLKIMRLLAIGLELPDENFFVDRCNAKHENMRMLHYPSLSIAQSDEDAEETVIRGNVHTDFGTITLLTQDDVGGLQAQRLDGSWVFVPPVANGIVVNVGDMLERWCANRLRATPHQVVDVSSSRCGEAGNVRIISERYSIAFFCNANKDTVLEYIDDDDGGKHASGYPPITAHEYLTQRLSQTISKEAASAD